MDIDAESCYRALAARDPRFDGLFFVGVTTTRIYIAMRGLRWPDAFPHGDLGLRKALGVKSARQVLDASEAWRPWRAYAAMHLWNNLNYLRTETSTHG